MHKRGGRHPLPRLHTGGHLGDDSWGDVHHGDHDDGAHVDHGDGAHSDHGNHGDGAHDPDVHGLRGQRAVLDPRSTRASKTRWTKSTQGSQSCRWSDAFEVTRNNKNIGIYLI